MYYKSECLLIVSDSVLLFFHTVAESSPTVTLKKDKLVRMTTYLRWVQLALNQLDVTCVTGCRSIKRLCV